MASNYEVNIKLNTRTVNKQLNNLEKRISKLNKLAQGGTASKTVLKNEKHKVQMASKRLQIENKNLRVKQNQLKVDRQQLKVEQQTANAINKQNRALTGSQGSGRGSGRPMGPSSPLNFTNQGTLLPGKGFGGPDGAIQSALISGAFPLLFGQGLLGGLAGGAGGFIGTKMGGQTGGFAGGLIATAALTQVQQIIDGVTAVGNAFSKTNLDITQVTKSLGLVGTPSAKYLQLLEQTQGKQAAYNESIKRLTRIVGDEGVKNLQEFGDASRQFANDVSVLTTRLAAAFAGFANKLNKKGLLGLGGLSKFTKPFETSGILRKANLNESPEMASLIAQRDALTAGRTGRDLGNVKRSDEYKNIRSQIIELQKVQEATQKLNDIENSRAAQYDEITRSVEKQNQFLNQSISLGVREAEIQQKLREFDRQALKFDEKINMEERKQYENALRLQQELERINSLYSGIANTVQTGLVNAIDGAITGTMTLGQVATSVFGSIRRQLIDFAATSLLRSIPGFGGFFADGGVTKPNKSYIVGEKGPELFTPGVTGKVTPNHELGGSSTNIVVNVDASGTSVEGDEQSAAQFGESIAAAVQAEILNQQMAGGLLS